MPHQSAPQGQQLTSHNSVQAAWKYGSNYRSRLQACSCFSLSRQTRELFPAAECGFAAEAHHVCAHMQPDDQRGGQGLL